MNLNTNGQKNLTPDEYIRWWYDQRDIGPLSKFTPFQSNIVLSSLDHQFHHGIDLFSNTKHDDFLQQKLSSTQCCKQDIVSIDPSHVSNIIFQSLRQRHVGHRNVNTLESSIEFCLRNLSVVDDTNKVSIAPSLKAAAGLAGAPNAGPVSNIGMPVGIKRTHPETELDQPVARLDHNRNRIPEQQPQQLKKAPPKNRDTVSDMNERETSEPHSNPFQSAKSQFVKDGGKLDALKGSNNSDGVNLKRTAGSICNKGPGAHAHASVDKNKGSSSNDDDSPLPPELQHCEKALVEKIESDIIHHGQAIRFDDIAGLEFAKKCVNELVCWPMLRPDLFQGLRSLPRGLLLFGPPGTGKTLIGKAIAHQAGATFFSISSSSLTSKWIGEGEKTVKTLFAVAAYRQPSVVFIDEVDSLLCQRSAEENEASRRMKTEFLVQLDGAGTNLDAQVTIVGATNRPEELDEAARRRFVKRIYIPLPDIAGRRQQLENLLRGNKHEMAAIDVQWLVDTSEGFSGADIKSLCTEAAMGPMRELASSQGNNLQRIQIADVPSIKRCHFEDALCSVTSSVSPSDLQRYLDWNATFGSFRRTE